MGLSTFLTASVLALRLFSLPCVASPCPQDDAVAVPATESPAPASPSAPVGDSAASGWWMSSIKRQGKPAFNPADYKVFRNVKDYGARGDGNSDDTEAINRAITHGNRCGQKCDSQTTTPAIVYFPPGTYVVSKPIIPYYYTQLVGDAVGMPTIKAKQGFEGIAVIDSDPYDSNGVNWWTNQNNFFRQIRNFRIDLTGLPKNTGTGIHWQVAQATSLQNIVFDMAKDKSDDNKQQGLFMDNGSGGFMTDLVFNGGRYGAFLGNQQFTTRNLTFKDCNTAICMNWNWVWTFHGLSVNNCGMGIDMSQGGAVQTVGSVLVLDSTFSNTPVGIATTYNPQQAGTNGTLVLDNVDMKSNVPVAVQLGGPNKSTLLAGNTLVAAWAQGRSYAGANGKAEQGPKGPVKKPQALVDASGRIATKSKPQYDNMPASRFVSVKSRGAKGDGKTDDTESLRKVFREAGPDDIVYFDHGAYLVTDTVQVPKDVKVVGEIWPLIMAAGEKFKDQDNPKPVFQVGQPGDFGNVEMQDLMFETQGPQPGAILMEFNVAGKTQASAGLFDVHFRVGGTSGTQLQMDKCAKNPKVRADPNPECIGAFMLLHVTASASPYLENVWMWVADHELDTAPYTQVNIYNGRGVLIESTKGAWLWGTSSEHNVLSNYQLNKAQNVFMALLQSETAYFQPNPDATKPFKSNPKYTDPDFSKCNGEKCARTWGMRINDSKDVLVYGGGLYSFFDNYDQVCVGQNNCQDNMIAVDGSQVELFGISTKASIAMVTLDGQPAAKDSDNRNNFCAAIAAFATSLGDDLDELDDGLVPKANPPTPWGGGGGNGSSTPAQGASSAAARRGTRTFCGAVATVTATTSIFFTVTPTT